jgi:hypothetical protein
MHSLIAGQGERLVVEVPSRAQTVDGQAEFSGWVGLISAEQGSAILTIVPDGNMSLRARYRVPRLPAC